MSTSLSLLHLRFTALAQTPIKLGGYQAGERLRDGLAQVMLRAVCPETQRASRPTPEHAAVCPACWLLAFQGRTGGAGPEAASEGIAGEVRRAYALAPPLPLPDLVQPGQEFAFTITLFGSGQNYLPYFVLAVSEMGREGVGPGRGQFGLRSIQAFNPYSDGPGEWVLTPGENLVRLPKLALTWEDARRAAQQWEHSLQANPALRVRFLTPTRLVVDEVLLKSPDFAVFFRRLLERIDDLRQQYAGEARRPAEEVEQLYRLADQVRLVQADTQWVDVWGPSGRTGRRTPMGGLVGAATYRAKTWGLLLPWLILGQGVQVGKLATKGNGVFQLELP